MLNSRFDWFFRSRTCRDLQGRADVLLKLIEDEVDRKQSGNYFDDNYINSDSEDEVIAKSKRSKLS